MHANQIHKGGWPRIPPRKHLRQSALICGWIWFFVFVFVRGWSVLGAHSRFGPGKKVKRYWLTVTLLPDSNDSTAAQANCSARRPARAGTGGSSPRLNASNIASKWRSKVR